MQSEITTAIRVAMTASLVLVTSSGFTEDWLVVDTGQDRCYNDSGTVIDCPAAGSAFFGQDSQHHGRQPSFVDNGAGTVTDLVTGLEWQQDPGDKLTWDAAVTSASGLDLGGFVDWRVPTIKELYSLIDFRGITGFSAVDSTPYIDTEFFEFRYGDVGAGERFIDAQYWSSTEYVSVTMHGDPTVFGVNFADGRIKGYPKARPGRTENAMFVRYVRGPAGYGENSFSDNGDGTVIDWGAGLMWSQSDSGRGLNWEDALAWIEAKNAERWLDHSDWRLPNAKELQSLVDYTRSPDTTHSPAIDSVFATSQIADGEYPFFWTSTTHLDGVESGSYAVYISFGRALGWMESPPGSGRFELLDVHGAGAQRSDPKTGNPDEFPLGHGPQGDVVRILNFVRAVRDVDSLPEPHPAPEATVEVR